MFKCNLVRPDGSIRELDTRILGDTTLGMTSALIANELGDRTHPDEIYLFGLQTRELSADRTYYICSQNSTDIISKERLVNYLLNVVGFSFPDKFLTKKQFTYNDLIALNLNGAHDIRVPMSIAVNAETEYPISTNPFNWVNEDTTIASNLETVVASRANAVVFDSHLSEPHIFCCLASDVLAQAQSKEEESVLARLYFPLLASRGIQTAAALRAARTDQATPPAPPSQKPMLTIINYGESSQSKMGVNEVTAVIHPTIPVHLPLELLFRSVPASAALPFIKYNMGKKGSRLYRVHAPVNKNGVKQPALTQRQLSRLQTAVSMHEGIGFAVLGHDSLSTLDVNPDGNLRVRFISQYSVPFVDIENRINNILQPALTSMNYVLNDTGFQFDSQIKLRGYNVDIQNISIKGDLKRIVRFVPGDVAGCLTPVMFSTETSENIAEYVYYRVGYYEQLSAIERYIVGKLRKGTGVRDVIAGLLRGFGMTESQATSAVAQWADKAQEELNAHANQRLKLVTSGGIDVQLTRDRKTRSATIVATGPLGLEHAELLSEYLRSAITASTAPVAADELKSVMGGCTENQKEVYESGVSSAAAASEHHKVELEVPDEPKAVTISDNRIVVDEDEDEDDLLDLYGDFEEGDDVNETELSDLLQSEDEPEPSTEAAIAKSQGSPVAEAETPTGQAAATAKPTPQPPLAKKKDADVAGMKLSDPNYFLNRLYERDPKLFLSKQEGRFDTYSRICPHNLRRQPVVLTQAEKDRMEREAPGSFDPSPKALIAYSSGQGPKNWYMCPRYWCLKTDLPMTQEQVDAGECGGKIIPYNAKVVPDDAFIFAFDSEGRNQEHVNKDGSYAQHYPGFLSGDKHPDGLCIPCCFKNVDQAKVRKRIEMCTKQEDEGSEGIANVRAAEAAEPKAASRHYVKDPNKFPLANGDVGFLAPVVQQLLNTNNAQCFVSEKDKTIRKDKPCLLRGGVGKNKERSLLFAVATAANISVDSLIQKLKSAITPKSISQYQQGTLVDSLMPREGRENKANASLSPDELKKMAADKLRSMLDDPKQTIGYQYFWDLVRFNAFPEVVNMLILLLDDDDGTSNPKLICPEAIKGNRQYSANRPTLLLLLKNGYYEPVMVFKSNVDANKAPLVPVERLLGLKNTEKPEVKEAVDRLGNIANGCGGETLVADGLPTHKEVARAITRGGGKINSLVVNFNGQLIGLQTEIPGYYKSLVVPVKTSQNFDVSDKDGVVLIGTASTMTPLNETLRAMKHFRQVSGMRLEPSTIIAEDGMAVAVQTLSDRVIPVIPSADYERGADNKYAGIEIYDVPSGDGPEEAARVSVLGSGKDVERERVAEQIKFYNQTYDLFRTWLRTLLLSVNNIALRTEITKIIKQNATVATKLRLLQGVLKGYLQDKIVFVDIVDLPKTGMVAQDGLFYIPNDLFNLDELLLRISDELIRFPSASKFILGRTMFYTTQSSEYILDKDELILPESMLVQTEAVAQAADELLQGSVGASAAISQNTKTEEDAYEVQATKEEEGVIGVEDVESAAAIVAVEAASEAPAAAVADKQCSKITKKPLGPNDKLIKRQLMVKGTIMITPTISAECIWTLIAAAISSSLNKSITYSELKDTIATQYRQLSDSDSKKASLMWRTERKTKQMPRGTDPTGPTLANIVKTDEYHASNIDLFYLAKAFGITIVIISSKITQQTGTEFITYSGAPDERLLENVIVFKRGQKGLTAVYSVLASPNEMKLNDLTPALSLAIKENLLHNPYKIPVQIQIPNPPPAP
jgi:hypothetical protein